MAPRASWKGFLKVAELTCPVALHAAASTSERIAFHTLNRATGHRVRRQFVDQETGKQVDADEQVKGYEVGQDDYVVLGPKEIAAAVPESDKTLAVQAFIRCDDIDTVYFDRPYYLSPGNAIAGEAYSLVRDGMRAKQVAALARTVLFRRVRTLLIRPHEDGLIATTLHFDYEVRSAEDAFRDVPAMQIKGRDARAGQAHHRHQARRLRSASVRRPLRIGTGRTRPRQARRRADRDQETREAR